MTLHRNTDRAARAIRGPFHLDKLSLVVSSAAVLWIAFIAVVSCLLQLNPANAQTLNYSPVAVGIAIVYSLGLWVVSPARKWFTGPIRQIVGEKEEIDVDPVVIDADKHEFSEKQ